MSDSDSEFGIWEGEVATELPAPFDASLYFIGRIRTPWTSRLETPRRRSNPTSTNCARVCRRSSGPCPAATTPPAPPGG